MDLHFLSNMFIVYVHINSIICDAFLSHTLCCIKVYSSRNGFKFVFVMPFKSYTMLLVYRSGSDFKGVFL